MANSNSFKIAVLPGDGIGPEVMAPALEAMAAAQSRVGGFSLDPAEHAAGAGHYRDAGDGLPAATVESCRASDATLLAAMGLPHIRYPDGTEIVPQIDLRIQLGLYAGVRPVKSIPGVKGPLADERANALDFVIVRESTEGLFATMGKGAIVNDYCATETMVLTRPNCERLFDFCYGLTRQRKADGAPGKLTLVDKANVFTSFAWMRKIFDERGEAFPDITRAYAYVDAAALDMIRKPWTFDVMVTENMYGDILSDLGAGLAGGMGMAPSADIGNEHAVFQPCHGTAPDITGQGKANPTAMILSAAMMLDWLGREKDSHSARVAGRLIEDAVTEAFTSHHLRPIELGGDAGTEVIRKAVLEAITTVALPELDD